MNPQNLVDDTENILSKEAIANFRNNSKSNSETGCTSPVKKKNPRKTRKVVAEPQNWGKNLRKTARNTGKEYTYYSKTDKEMKKKNQQKLAPIVAAL